MDIFGYLNILKENLQKSADNFYFHQDNDLKHKLSVLSPGQSPDLSPVEHLWNELGKRVRKQQTKITGTVATRMERNWSRNNKEIGIFHAKTAYTGHR